MTAVLISSEKNFLFGGSKWAKWPLIKRGLSFEIRPEKSERHAYTSRLMKRWSVP